MNLSVNLPPIHRPDIPNPCPVCFGGLSDEVLLPSGRRIPPRCFRCGWVMPSPWRLLRLLDAARNHVTDPGLRAEIQDVIPPQPRTWPPEVLRCFDYRHLRRLP